MKKDIKIIRKYFSLINADKKYLVKYIVVLIFSNIYNMIIPLIYGNIISNTMANLYKMAYILLIVYLLTYLIGSLIKYIEWKTYARFFKKIYTNLQNKAIDALYKMPIYKLTSEERGKQINIVTEDIGSISHYFESVILEIMDIILIISIPIILFIIDIYIGLLVIIVTILNTYFLGKYNNKIEKIKTKRKKHLDLRTSFVTGIINGLKDIKILNLDKKLYAKYQKINNKFTNAFIKEIDVRAIKSVIIPMFIFVVESIIIGISIYFISINRVGIEHVVIIISYYTILNEIIREVLYMSEDLRNINVCINRVEKLNDYANNNQLPFGNNNKDNIKGIIEFKNVSFGYNKELVLKNISFKILPNTVTAIVVKSGSGKSTIYNLLLRFCKPKKGIIKMDDINIMNYTTDTYLLT